MKKSLFMSPDQTAPGVGIGVGTIWLKISLSVCPSAKFNHESNFSSLQGTIFLFGIPFLWVKDFLMTPASTTLRPWPCDLWWHSWDHGVSETHLVVIIYGTWVMVKVVKYFCCLVIKLAFVATWYSVGIVTEGTPARSLSQACWIYEFMLYLVASVCAGGAGECQGMLNSLGSLQNVSLYPIGNMRTNFSLDQVYVTV